MLKNLKIVNKSKFARSVSIVVLMILGTIFFSTKVSLSHNEKDQMDYDTITIIQGDTLWNIADEQQMNNPYFENKDIREIIYQIKKVNQLKTSSLQIGQKLQIPVI